MIKGKTNTLDQYFSGHFDEFSSVQLRRLVTLVIFNSDIDPTLASLDA